MRVCLIHSWSGRQHGDECRWASGGQRISGNRCRVGSATSAHCVSFQPWRMLLLNRCRTRMSGFPQAFLVRNDFSGEGCSQCSPVYRESSITSTIHDTSNNDDYVNCYLFGHDTPAHNDTITHTHAASIHKVLIVLHVHRNGKPKPNM